MGIDSFVVFECVTSTLRCQIVASCCLSHRSFLPFQSFSFVGRGEYYGLRMDIICARFISLGSNSIFRNTVRSLRMLVLAEGAAESERVAV